MNKNKESNELKYILRNLILNAHLELSFIIYSCSTFSLLNGSFILLYNKKTNALVLLQIDKEIK